jgi:hypothetical protein
MSKATSDGGERYLMPENLKPGHSVSSRCGGCLEAATIDASESNALPACEHYDYEPDACHQEKHGCIQ